MAAYKFYNQYAMKTNDLNYYLENFEDRAVFNALYLANGDRNLAHKILEELISQRYQPATPTFLNAGKKRRGKWFHVFLLILMILCYRLVGILIQLYSFLE